MSDIVGLLPMEERAAYYRKQALDALARAGAAIDPKTRDSYVNLARKWHALAVQIEEMLSRVSNATPVQPRDRLAG